MNERSRDTKTDLCTSSRNGLPRIVCRTAERSLCCSCSRRSRCSSHCRRTFPQLCRLGGTEKERHSRSPGVTFRAAWTVVVGDAVHALGSRIAQRIDARAGSVDIATRNRSAFLLRAVCKIVQSTWSVKHRRLGRTIVASAGSWRCRKVVLQAKRENCTTQSFTCLQSAQFFPS